MAKSTTLGTEPGRRTEIERDLTDRYAVKWSYTTGVSAARFDVEASLANQVRFVPLDTHTVATYREAVRRGDVFPAVIAWRPNGATKLHVIDGNHRLQAHMEEGQSLDVYEVDPDTDARAVAVMSYTFNTRHGIPTSEAERITHALWMIDNGSTYDMAAGVVNLDPKVLKRAMLKVNDDRRADEVGIKRTEWESLTPATRHRLAQIATDEGMAAATRLTVAARLSWDEVTELANRLGNSRSSTAQVKLVRDARENEYAERVQGAAGGVLQDNSKGIKGMRPKTRLSIAVGQVMALPNTAELYDSYTKPERAQVAGRLIECSERLRKMANQIDPSVS